MLAVALFQGFGNDHETVHRLTSSTSAVGRPPVIMRASANDLLSPRERRTLLQEPQEMLELRFVVVVGTLLVPEEQGDILDV